MDELSSGRENLKELTLAVAENALENSIHEKETFTAYAYYVQAKLFYDNPDFERSVNNGFKVIVEQISKK